MHIYVYMSKERRKVELYDLHVYTLYSLHITLFLITNLRV